VLTTNCSNNYGPYHFPREADPAGRHPRPARRALPVYGKGENVRDWLHVEDHAEALTLVLRRAGRARPTMSAATASGGTSTWCARSAGLLDEMLPDSPNRPHERLIEFVTDRPGTTRATPSTPRRSARARLAAAAQFRPGAARDRLLVHPQRSWWERVMSGAYRGERLGLASQ
jgi:dTDP-glucose 4,6-dehydratase